MKILWLYSYSSNYNLDKWFHLELVRWMKANGYDIQAYGPGLEREYRDIAPFRYNPYISWDEVVKTTGADVAILNTKSRQFHYYSPHTKIYTGCYLNPGFETSTIIPKVVIEEDDHYETDGIWYQKNGINLVLQRHYSQAQRNWGVKTLWYPFSVDEQIFAPSTVYRNNRICFAGHMTDPYPCRRVVCENLSKKNLIDVFQNREKVDMQYVLCLQQYVAHLSTPSIYDISAAKNFEIMSSGSVLFTPRFSGIDKLFPKDAYCEINIDGSDCVEKATRIINDEEYRKITAERGRQCILENHTNSIRTKELINILRYQL
jgi:spore maturation protein CgeB